jgi:hypothetical protein
VHSAGTAGLVEPEQHAESLAYVDEDASRSLRFKNDSPSLAYTNGPTRMGTALDSLTRRVWSSAYRLRFGAISTASAKA